MTKPLTNKFLRLCWQVCSRSCTIEEHPLDFIHIQKAPPPPTPPFEINTVVSILFVLVQVFTSMALFSILISPLNAFPWVINGLMEAWVSTKRIQAFLKLSELDIDQYYASMADTIGRSVFHTGGGVPWDFPHLTQIPPSSFADSNVYFRLVSHPRSPILLMILCETLYICR